MPAGAKVVIEPGRTEDARLTPIGGARVMRGHGGLVDGPLDAPGAREAALALARSGGTSMPDGGLIRLGDSDLWVEPEARPRPRARRDRRGLGRHPCATGSACAPSGVASTSPSSAALCWTRFWACAERRSESGTAASCAVGRAGNPDTMDGIDVVLDTETAVVRCPRSDRHARRASTRTCTGSRPRSARPRWRAADDTRRSRTAAPSGTSASTRPAASPHRVVGARGRAAQRRVARARLLVPTRARSRTPWLRPAARV